MTLPADRPPKSWRSRVLVGAAVGWIVVVVAGSGSSANDSLLGVENLDVVWTIILVLTSLLGLAIFVFVNPFASEWTQPEKKQRSLTFWLFAAAAFALLVWRPELLDNLVQDADEQAVGDVLAPATEVTPESAPVETVAQATDLLLLAAAVGALAAVWLLVKRRGSTALADATDSSENLETDFVQALDDAVRELEAPGDPRSAVLRSYAVLETVLAANGFPRSRAETPVEHMRRSLLGIRVSPEPLVELGSLYEIARFSDHEISPEQQGDAARALDRARTSLASVL